jgi:hypothetical protein
VSLTALTSAEISLPTEADGARVSDRIAVLTVGTEHVGSLMQASDRGLVAEG